MYQETLTVRRDKVAWLRFLLEAEDGLATFHVFADGKVVLCCAEDRKQELNAWIACHRDMLL